jgi:hypothetical protein
MSQGPAYTINDPWNIRLIIRVYRRVERHPKDVNSRKSIMNVSRKRQSSISDALLYEFPQAWFVQRRHAFTESLNKSVIEV